MSYELKFESEAQRELFDRYRTEIRNLDWEAIGQALKTGGEYRLGLERDLLGLPGTLSSAPDGAADDRKSAWLNAMIEVVVGERRLSFGHRTDAETRQSSIWITLPTPLRPGRRSGRSK